MQCSLATLVWFTFVLATVENCSRAALVFYDFTNQPGNQVIQLASTVEPHVNATGITRGMGLIATSAANSFSSSGWHTLADNDYIEFGLSVEPGFKANPTTLTFTARASSTGPGTMALRSSTDGFTNNLASWAQTASSDVSVTANLGGLGDLYDGIWFRILATSNQSAGGGTMGASGTWRLGTMTNPGNSSLLTLNGNVSALTSVPEPPSHWLAAAACLVGAICHRLSRFTVTVQGSGDGF